MMETSPYAYKKVDLVNTSKSETEILNQATEYIKQTQQNPPPVIDINGAAVYTVGMVDGKIEKSEKEIHEYIEVVKTLVTFGYRLWCGLNTAAIIALAIALLWRR